MESGESHKLKGRAARETSQPVAARAVDETPAWEPAALRRRALELLDATRADISSLGSEEIQRLVYELQVHQMELEIQNEELRQAQLQLACARDRFSDLYDFAPVGYVTLDRSGTIIEANLTAGVMLGAARGALPAAKLSDFVARESQDACYLHLRDVFGGNPQAPDGSRLTCALVMQRKDRSALTVRLESMLFQDESRGSAVCRTALIDVTAQSHSQRQLAEKERALRAITDNTPALISYVDRKQCLRFVNRMYAEWFACPAEKLLGGLLRSQFDEAAYKSMTSQVELALAGKGCMFEAEFFFPATGKRWMQVCHVADIDPATGEVLGFYSLMTDMSDRRRAEEERENLVTDELNHRLKNLLSHVVAMAQQTLSGAQDMQTFKHSIEGRVIAIAEMHDLLMKGRWRSVVFEDLLERAAQAHQPRASMCGPPLMLSPEAAKAFYLTLHELFTNALKHGALSVEQGRIEMQWALASGQAEPGFLFKWTERGGPAVAPGKKRGVGRKMLDMLIVHELKGSVTMRLAKGGMRCTIKVPGAKHFAPLVKPELK